MVFSTNGFPQLKHLTLYDAPRLKRLRVNKGAMPSLKDFKYWSMVPEGLRYITTCYFYPNLRWVHYYMIWSHSPINKCTSTSKRDTERSTWFGRSRELPLWRTSTPVTPWRVQLLTCCFGNLNHVVVVIQIQLTKFLLQICTSCHCWKRKRASEDEREKG